MRHDVANYLFHRDLLNHQINMSLPGHFAEFLEQLSRSWPAEKWGRHRIVVAVSGGPDSMLLLHGLWTLWTSQEGHRVTNQHDSPIVAVHINHHLRGDDSDRDQGCVEAYCERHAIPVETCHLDAEQWSQLEGQGLEGAARRLRYEQLAQKAQAFGARYIATAHTLNDQVETVLQRLFRGTSVKGLSGMKRQRRLVDGVTLIRPMLQIDRELIMSAIAEAKVPYRTDSTNLDGSNQRSRLRAGLIPHLQQEFNSNIDRSLLQLAESAAEYHAFLESVVTEAWDRVVKTCETASKLESAAAPLSLQAKQTLSAERISLRGNELIDLDSLVLRNLLIRVWERQGWSQKDMDRQRWQRCESFIRQKLGDDNTRSAQAFQNESFIRDDPHQLRLALPEKVEIQWLPEERIFEIARRV